MKNLILFLSIAVASSLLAQKKSEEILLDNGITAAKFISISGSTIKRTLKDPSKVKRATPEELLHSYISANNMGWYKSLFKDPSSSYTQADLDKRNKTQWYIEPICMIRYTYNNKEYCIVKYYIVENGSKLAPTQSMAKHDGKWYFDSDTNLEYISSLMFLFKVDFLHDIFVKRNTNSQYVNDILTKTINNGKLDVVSFVTLFSENMKEHRDELVPNMESLK